MVDITPLLPADRQLIQGYGGGGFRIAGFEYPHSVFVTETETSVWEVSDVAEMSLPPEIAAGSGIAVLLIGTGRKIVQIPPQIRQSLRMAGIGVEIMDTGAACRTFNVLLSEERAVAALLIAVDDDPVA
ncbi:MAG: hypothetical protein ACI9MJ_000059 [Alphaproteobacteria bacterium]|jgi:uncharacterized protein